MWAECNTDTAAITVPSYTRHIRPLDRAGSHQLAVFRSVPSLVMEHNLIAPTKCTQFIHHTHLLYFLYMFRCYIHSLRQGNSVRGTKVVSGDDECYSEIRGDADKSLARPGRRQATETTLGIYSTHSPRRSIHFLARCFNFCKSHPNSCPRQQ